MGKRKELSICLNCDVSFKANYSSTGTYCSNKCQQDYNFKNIIKQIEEGAELAPRIMKRYLISKFGSKCLSKDCGWDWSKPSIIELEHIDGNSNNNKLDNLTLLCPNCHAITPTYKNKNKGNGRHKRRERYSKGLSY
jgi:hypothetical protein